MTEQTDTTLRDAAHRLATAREHAATMAVQVDEARREWEAAHADLLRQHAEAAQGVAHADEILRRLAVAIHETTGEKSLGYGVSVVLSEKLGYDQAEAVQWAEQTGMLPVVRGLDWKAFDKIAKASQLPFVTKTATPQVRVASDLSAALAAEVAS